MTNLELTTGEREIETKKTSTSQRYEVRFRSGSKTIVKQEVKLALDDALDKFWAEGKDAMVKLKDGTRVSISQITEIRVIREHTSDITARANSERIRKMLNEKYSNSRSEGIRKWCERISDNFARLERGEPWQYYTKEGKPCSREESAVSNI